MSEKRRAKLRPGVRVQVMRGLRKGEIGTVTQTSVGMWMGPMVEVEFEGGRRGLLESEELRVLESA